METLLEALHHLLMAGQAQAAEAAAQEAQEEMVQTVPHLEQQEHIILITLQDQIITIHQVVLVGHTAPTVG
jgi:hypothetical protein